jgi:hypothetical protein
MTHLPEFTGIGDAQTTVNEMMQSNVAFFEAQQPIAESIIGRHTQLIPPSTDIDYEHSPVQFEIKNAGQHYLDFGAARLMGTFKVLNDDNTKLGADEEVAIINNFPHALWDDITVTIDGSIQTELGTSRYGHKAYFEQLFSYNKYCEGHTKPLSLFYIDTPDKYEECGTANEGYTARKKLIALSKPCHFNVPLLIDFFALNKLWPNCNSILLTLTRKRPSFLLMAKDESKEYKIKFERLMLKIDKVTLHPQLYKATELQLLSQNMVYHYDKCVVKEHSIKQNQTLVDFNEIISGQIPKYFLLTIAKTSSLTGNYKECPWKFDTHDLTKLYCKINGQTVPNYPYEFNFKSAPPNCLTAFASLYDDLGINRAAKEHYVDMAQFTGGAFILPFSFCPDLCFGRNFHPPSTGQISIHMQFGTALTSAHTLLLFIVYDEEIHVDASRQIIFPRGRQIP